MCTYSTKAAACPCCKRHERHMKKVWRGMLTGLRNDLKSPRHDKRKKRLIQAAIAWVQARMKGATK